jgi:hypothetical protein
MSELDAEGIPLDDLPPGLEEDDLIEETRSPRDVGDDVGRLIEPDQGVAGLDHERDPVAGLTEDDDGLSAEEAAMHITDLP